MAEKDGFTLGFAPFRITESAAAPESDRSVGAALHQGIRAQPCWSIPPKRVRTDPAVVLIGTSRLVIYGDLQDEARQGPQDCGRHAADHVEDL
jgi:hypothetical protein